MEAQSPRRIGSTQAAEPDLQRAVSPIDASPPHPHSAGLKVQRSAVPNGLPQGAHKPMQPQSIDPRAFSEQQQLNHVPVIAAAQQESETPANEPATAVPVGGWVAEQTVADPPSARSNFDTGASKAASQAQNDAH